MYFCAARLEKDKTKRGSDALHLFPHSSSLRGNGWCDAPRLRPFSVDAEHLVTSSIFRGSTARLTTTLAHELRYLSLGFHAAYVDASEPVKKRALKFFLLQRSTPLV